MGKKQVSSNATQSCNFYEREKKERKLKKEEQQEPYNFITHEISGQPQPPWSYSIPVHHCFKKQSHAIEAAHMRYLPRHIHTVKPQPRNLAEFKLWSLGDLLSKLG